jgi:pimeloyl-ACP methyl ester carboxylesterase
MKKRTDLALAIVILLTIFLGSCAARKTRGEFRPPVYPLTEKSVELLGTRVVYVEGGTGKPVVFIHGVGGAVLDWEKVLPYFAQRYDTIALDQPGFGKSEKKMDYPYSIDTNAKIVIALLDYKKIDKAFIVGNSMGGEVAAYLAIHYPERVEKLVLVDAAGALKVPHTCGVPQLAWLLGKPIYSMSVSIGSNDLHAADPERIQPNIATAIFKSDEWWGMREAWRDDFADIIKLDLKPELKKISAPTLVIWGSQDPLLKAHHKWMFWERIPGSELLIIKGGDHTPQLSKPREFEAAVDGFLSGVPNPDYQKRGERVILE